ncbi:hypothetical protein MASR1M48_16590 [Lactococcus petauri]
MNGIGMPFLIADMVKLKYLFLKIRYVKQVNHKASLWEIFESYSKKGYLTPVQLIFLNILYNRTRETVKQYDREDKELFRD